MSSNNSSKYVHVIKPGHFPANVWKRLAEDGHFYEDCSGAAPYAFDDAEVRPCTAAEPWLPHNLVPCIGVERAAYVDQQRATIAADTRDFVKGNR